MKPRWLISATAAYSKPTTDPGSNPTPTATATPGNEGLEFRSGQGPSGGKKAGNGSRLLEFCPSHLPQVRQYLWSGSGVSEVAVNLLNYFPLTGGRGSDRIRRFHLEVDFKTKGAGRLFGWTSFSLTEIRRLTMCCVRGAPDDFLELRSAIQRR